MSPQNNGGGSTRVEPLRGSNGRPTPIILRFIYSTDAFTLLLEKRTFILSGTNGTA